MREVFGAVSTQLFQPMSTFRTSVDGGGTGSPRARRMKMCSSIASLMTPTEQEGPF